MKPGFRKLNRWNHNLAGWNFTRALIALPLALAAFALLLQALPRQNVQSYPGASRYDGR